MEVVNRATEGGLLVLLLSRVHVMYFCQGLGRTRLAQIVWVHARAPRNSIFRARMLTLIRDSGALAKTEIAAAVGAAIQQHHERAESQLVGDHMQGLHDSVQQIRPSTDACLNPYLPRLGSLFQSPHTGR